MGIDLRGHLSCLLHGIAICGVAYFDGGRTVWLADDLDGVGCCA